MRSELTTYLLTWIFLPLGPLFGHKIGFGMPKMNKKSFGYKRQYSPFKYIRP